MLRLRHLVTVGDDGLFSPNPAEVPLLRYYANAIAHLPLGARHSSGAPA
jgi:hypothetical protein